MPERTQWQGRSLPQFAVGRRNEQPTYPDLQGFLWAVLGSNQ
jgi:hypothetical protein